MEVKCCPSCGHENKASRASCIECYAALDGVEVTQSDKPEPQVPVQ